MHMIRICPAGRLWNSSSRSMVQATKRTSSTELAFGSKIAAGASGVTANRSR